MFGLIAVFLLGIVFSGVTHHQHLLIQTDEKAHTDRIMVNLVSLLQRFGVCVLRGGIKPGQGL